MSAQRSDCKCKCAMDAVAAHATSIGPRRLQKHPRNSPARENFLLLLADAEQRDIAAATASMRFEGNSAPTLSPGSSSTRSTSSSHIVKCMVNSRQRTRKRVLLRRSSKGWPVPGGKRSTGPHDPNRHAGQIQIQMQNMRRRAIYM